MGTQLTLTQQNTIGAAVTAFIGNLLPFLVLVGVLDWGGETIAAAMLVVNSFVTMAGLVYAQMVTKQAYNAPPPAP